MKKSPAWIAAMLMLGMGAYYCVLIVRQEIEPALATWLLFGVAVSLSYATYWRTAAHSLAGNVANAIDVVVVGCVVVCLLLFGKTVTLTANAVEIACFTLSGAIMVFWKVTQKHTLANIALQCIMSIAYAPTLYKLWHANSTTESPTTWMLGLGASAAALTSSIVNRDRLGIVYSARAAFFTAAVLLLTLIK